ncbi:hypothetical protein KSP39_PZI009308 [Platanthera zijinensis]|uniref:PB1 domain-containing protein n=1 Tax=Platanthera zijinensis TaxID=2320716 RepID=A0AAP0G7D3_9ASPA
MDTDSNNPRSDNNLQPQSRWDHDESSAGHAGGQRVRLMCSFGGRILPRPHDQQLRYVGGDTRMIAIPRCASFSTLLSKLSKIAGSSVSADQISIKYQLPNEDLDSLVSLTSDEDVDNMMDEYDRVSASRTPRLRLFLFHPGADPVSSASSSGTAFGSILDGGSKTEDWFLDALNGSGAPTILERGRSEVSSIVSEVPDYLFGFDNNSDETPTAATQSRPAPADFYFSEKTITSPPPLETTSAGDVRQIEPRVHQQTGYAPNPVWHYVADPGPVYYVPGPVMPGGNLPVQPAQMSFPYAHQVVRGPGPFGYTQPFQAVPGNPIHSAPVYVGGPPPPVMAAAFEYPIQAVPGEAYEVVGARGLIRHPTMPSPMYQSPGIAPVGAELPLAGSSDFKAWPTSQ